MERADGRVLIVVFDALRPEFVTPELMPNLAAFAARGVRYTASRAAFPSETRVNQTTVTTGCLPARHGVVANRFPFPGRAEVIDTGRDEDFAPAMTRLRESGARLVEVPTMGEMLAAAGCRLASISAGTSGGGRILHLHAEETGGFRLALRHPEAAVPSGVFARIVDRLGPPPAQEVPGLAWNSYALDCWLDWVEPELRPEVSLLWLSEPDESFHWHGIGAPASLTALRHLDAEFGRLLARKGAELQTGALQLIAMSDHGQISLRGPKLDLVARMRAAGFRAGATPGPDTDYLVAVHNAGGIWVRDGRWDLIEAMVAWLRGQDWCGPLFTAEGLAGTLPRREIGVEHPRAADIVLALAHDETPNAWGRAGTSADAAPYPEGGGCHGGLSRFELANFLALGGSTFRDAAVIDLPAGNADILPTVCALLDIAPPGPLDGRVLVEAFADGRAIGDAPTARVIEAEAEGGRRTRLACTDYQGRRYLDAAWLE